MRIRTFLLIAMLMFPTMATAWDGGFGGSSGGGGITPGSDADLGNVVCDYFEVRPGPKSMLTFGDVGSWNPTPLNLAPYTAYIMSHHGEIDFYSTDSAGNLSRAKGSFENLYIPAEIICGTYVRAPTLSTTKITPDVTDGYVSVVLPSGSNSTYLQTWIGADGLTKATLDAQGRLYIDMLHAGYFVTPKVYVDELAASAVARDMKLVIRDANFAVTWYNYLSASTVAKVDINGRGYFPSLVGMSTVLEFPEGLNLPKTDDAITGIIYKDGLPWIHDYVDPTGNTADPYGKNIFMGEDCGNFTLGSTATSHNDSSYNVALGYRVLKRLTTGNQNIGIGLYALTNATTAVNAIAMGESSQLMNQTGSGNISIGAGTMQYGTALSSSVAIGQNSLRSFNGSNSTAVGVSSLNRVTTGSSNNGFGYGAGWHITTGQANNAIGTTSMGNCNSGSYNSSFGHDSAQKIESGAALLTMDGGVFLGAKTRAKHDSSSNEIVVGYNAYGNGSNTATLGNDDITDTYLKGKIHLKSTTYSEGPAPSAPADGYTQYCDSTDGSARIIFSDGTIIILGVPSSH